VSALANLNSTWFNVAAILMIVLAGAIWQASR
jgi:hypothetical protein